MNSALRKLAKADMALRVPLTGVQQIEASAGTGKTYTIAGLYARLIVEQKRHVRDVLVMTFTKAATEELRQRLRTRLKQCARLAGKLAEDAASPEPTDGDERWALALLQRTLEAGDELATDLARRLDTAVQSMDEAAIFTINGFCQRVLREHAALIESVGGDAELQSSDDDLLEEFAADAWLRLAGDNASREALLAFGNDPQALAKTLKDLVDFHGRIEPAVAASAASEPPDPVTLRAAVVRAWIDGGDDAVAMFEQALSAKHLNGTSYKSGSLQEIKALQQDLVGGGWPDAKALKKFSGEKLKDAPNKNKPAFPGHPAFAAIDAWRAAEQAWKEHVEDRTAIVLHQLVTDARAWLRRRKRELARMSYADQIDWVHVGLEDGARGEQMCAELRKQYPVALVDEFQDTDARQFEIFQRLYAEHGVLFCIGDPKQAIYGFRGGDVHAYLRARGPESSCWRLDHNFRSAPGFLTACAGLFGGRTEVFVEKRISFKAVQAGGHVADDGLCLNDKPVKPMSVWQLSKDQAKAKKEDIEVALVAACAGEVARLLVPQAATLNGEALQAKSIAVLVNSNAQAKHMQDGLSALGVAAACLRQESIFATPEALELRRILDALLNPRHAGLARGALATHLLGRTLSDLQTMHHDSADWRAELDDLRARWFDRGVLAMLERLGESHARRLLSELDGERCLSNLMQLGDGLQAQARKLSSARAQRDWLAQRITLADDKNEDEQLRLASDAERVQIMTLHASKGLEFDLVFLPFAARMHTHTLKKGEFARFHDGDELVQRFLAHDKDSRTEDDDAAIVATQREDLAEGVRKLYVGVTRAKHACWLSLPAVLDKGASRVLDHVLEDGGVAGLEERGEGQIVLTALPDAAVSKQKSKRGSAARHAREFTRNLDRAWRSHSFSRLTDDGHAAHHGGAVAELGERLPTLAGLRGSRFGSAVHDVLEHADFAAWASDPVPDTQHRIVTRALAAQGIAGAAAESAVVELVATSLRAPMLDDLTLATLKPADYRAEMEFHFGIAGIDPQAWLALLHQHGYQSQRQSFAHLGTRLAGLMNGIIDLVFIHDGRWWIADYKTNHLGEYAEDYAPERLLDAVRASDYDLQYLIYSVALHRWLRQVRGSDYDYARDFGGVRYLFLRGMGYGGPDNGVFADRPSPELIEAMDHLLHAPEVAA